MVDWFFDSLINQSSFDLKDLSVVFVTRTANPGNFILWGHEPKEHLFGGPKPNVWQGHYRLTKEDWFAAANARNTALCLAPDGYIAYCDDLSVLMPGWLSAVRESMNGGYVACGAYKKVKDLKVENGIVKSYTEFPAGMDARWQYVHADPSPAERGWLFGCSCAMPVEALLTINGWPEMCDGTGFEDCCTGIALSNAGYKLMYDRRMLTLESEEHHHIEPSLRREDWHYEGDKPVLGGNGLDDKSHALLNIAEQSKRFENYCDMRELRQKVLSGEPFPITQIPEHEWYSKLPLREL